MSGFITFFYPCRVAKDSLESLSSDFAMSFISLSYSIAFFTTGFDGLINYHAKILNYFVSFFNWPYLRHTQFLSEKRMKILFYLRVDFFYVCARRESLWVVVLINVNLFLYKHLIKEVTSCYEIFRKDYMKMYN